jgi:lipid A disaccharide synthetase
MSESNSDIVWSLRNSGLHGKFTITGDQLTEKDLYSNIGKRYKIFRVCDGVCFVSGTITLEIESEIPGFNFDIVGRLSVPPSLFAIATKIMDGKLYSLKEGKFHEIIFTEAQDQLLGDAASRVSNAKQAKEAADKAKDAADKDLEQEIKSAARLWRSLFY